MNQRRIEAHAALLDGSQHVVLLAFHRRHGPTGRNRRRTCGSSSWSVHIGATAEKLLAGSVWLGRDRSLAASHSSAVTSGRPARLESLVSRPADTASAAAGNTEPGGTRGRKHSRRSSQAGQVGGARVHRLPVLATCPASCQHVTIPASLLDEGQFTDGHGFDGSSIRGFQQIQESDMVLIADPDTFYVDPF